MKFSPIINRLLPRAVFGAALAALLLAGCGAAAPQRNQALLESGDLRMPLEEISEKATFYPVELDGVDMEVLAVKAGDGTVRTAFNTCQVCFDSGRGYYEQEGEYLVCQNCGNRFKADEVELYRGGCNPVPITAEYKWEEDGAILVSGELLWLARDIFLGWRN